MQKLERIESYSGHGDYREMGDYISCQDPARLQEQHSLCTVNMKRR
ncbi:MAG: hypothetical protein MZV63_01825 [Marinilabiliales bacterium]|nr:hypothetical protein [Marinilabiliales bacterium]